MSSTQLDPSHCFSNNLYKTARAVSRLYAQEMRPTGLARSQFAILEHLARSDGSPTSALAQCLYMERTTLTRNLRPLERAGWVSRTTAPDDARVKLVVITEPGRRKLKEARSYWRKAQKRMLTMFGEDEWRQLEDSLRTMRRLVG